MDIWNNDEHTFSIQRLQNIEKYPQIGLCDIALLKKSLDFFSALEDDIIDVRTTDTKDAIILTGYFSENSCIIAPRYSKEESA